MKKQPNTVYLSSNNKRAALRLGINDRKAQRGYNAHTLWPCTYHWTKHYLDNILVPKSIIAIIGIYQS